MSEIEETAAPQGRGWSDWIAIAVALAGSAALVWLASRDPVIPAVFAGAVLVLVLAFGTRSMRRPETEAAEFALPDWSVTVAAIERPDTAVAVVDRAGRLVCANGRYR